MSSNHFKSAWSLKWLIFNARVKNKNARARTCVNFHFVSSASNFTLIGDNYGELAAEPPIPLRGKIDIFRKKLFWLKIRNFNLSQKSVLAFKKKSSMIPKIIIKFVILRQSIRFYGRSFYLNILKLIWKFFGNSAKIFRFFCSLNYKCLANFWACDDFLWLKSFSANNSVVELRMLYSVFGVFWIFPS